jgi:hypothetical protein
VFDPPSVEVEPNHLRLLSLNRHHVLPAVAAVIDTPDKRSSQNFPGTHFKTEPQPPPTSKPQN